MINHSMNPYRYKQLQRKARARGLVCVVGGLISDGKGRIFVLKRSEDRDLFPGCWDIPGGHVEEGESLFAALQREIHEETGWQLSDVLEEISIFEWKPPKGNPGQPRLEFDFLVMVQGDLETPRLESGNFSAYHWIGRDDLDLLKENRSPEDPAIYQVVEKAFDLTKAKTENL